MSSLGSARVWGYRRGADGVESHCFDGSELPEGWADSPARVDEPTAAATQADDASEVTAAEPVEPVRKRAGRPRKVDV